MFEDSNNVKVNWLFFIFFIKFYHVFSENFFKIMITVISTWCRFYYSKVFNFKRFPNLF